MAKNNNVNEQLLQPRCPKCGSEVGWESKGEVLRIWCVNYKEHDIYIRSLAELGKFFSAPPASPAAEECGCVHGDSNQECSNPACSNYHPSAAPLTPRKEKK